LIKNQINTEDIISGITRHIPNELLETAENGGYEVYAVGGCIRDLLLGRKIGDIDLAVVGDATHLAREVAERLKPTKVAVYSRFGTAMIMIGGRSFEFATARRESYLPDSRKPSEVIPVAIEEDLARRDFTVNALALGLTGNRSGELLDRFNGMTDLEKRLVRTPLKPDKTFSDDPLRMLRGIRFATELAFDIEPGTWQGISRNSARMKIVASERIGEEIWKMLTGADPTRAMQLLIDSGLMQIIMPEVAAMSGVEQVGRHHHKDVLRHSLRVMQNIVENTSDPVVRFAGLLHDIGKPLTKNFDPENGWTFYGHEAAGARITGRIGRRLQIGRENLKRLTRLVRLHMRPVNLTSEGVTDKAIRRLMIDAGESLDDQLILCRADITTANPRLVNRYLANFDEMARRMSDVEARDRMRCFQSPVRGEEIMKVCEIGPGPQVGALKGRIEDAILDGIISGDYEAAMQYLLEIKDEVLKSDQEELLREIRNRSRSRKIVDREFMFPDDVIETDDRQH